MAPPDTPTSGCQDVCSLPPDELQERKQALRRDVLSRATRRQPLADGWAIDFAHTAAMEKALQNLVVFERECCSGLSWNVDRPAEDVLRLRVEGLAPDSDLFQALAAEPAAGD